jgi:hypothetical protein
VVIYEKPVRELIPEMLSDLELLTGETFSKKTAIEWFARRYPRVKKSTVSAHLTRFSTNAPSRVYYNPGADEDLLFQIDRSHYRLYNAATDPGPLRTGEDVAANRRQRAAPLLETVPPINIEGNLRAYLAARSPEARYASFDYCFNYFQSHQEEGRLPDLLRGEALQLSCLQLGFYLASWGMLRGSSDLLQRSARHLAPVIEVISTAPMDVWRMDADQYGDGRCAAVFDTAGRIRSALSGGASDTLVTKIMLGVFGCVPAFDTYFKKGFDVSTFGPSALRKVGEFYSAHTDLIERHRPPTIEFESGAPTQLRYTRAKVIDMIFFVAGAS